ncbi:MAG: glycosyltransferase family 2 protein [Acidimicrobiia bacterium]
MTKPMVRAVVVHHRNPALTARCLANLAALDWPADRLDVVVVDNGSGDDVDALVAGGPARVVRAGRNLGFAGGCNLGIGDLDGVDLVALVNNDAYVEPGWLRALAGALDDDPGLAAATPRVLFDDGYVELVLSSPTGRRTPVDRRPVGATVHGVRVDGEDAWDRCRRAEGFWGPEPGPDGWVERTRGDARLLVPVGDDRPDRPGRVELLVSGPTGRSLRVAGAGGAVEIGLAPTAAWHPAPPTGGPVEHLNNVGTVVLADLHGADRGIHEPAAGRYLQDADVEAWSGTAPLLRAEHLRRVGLFDERLFAYYEDVDLALRATAAGWRHRYVAGAVVRHTHAATSGLRTERFTFLNERNRLLLVAWHRGRRQAWIAAARHLASTGGYVRRDVLGRLADRRAPWLGQVRPRLRAVAAVATSTARGHHGPPAARR